MGNDNSSYEKEEKIKEIKKIIENNSKVEKNQEIINFQKYQIQKIILNNLENFINKYIVYIT